MKKIVGTALSFLLLASIANAGTYRDDFSKGKIDAALWCDCQIDPNYPIRAGNASAGADGTILIDADSRDVGGNVCQFDPVKECVRPDREEFDAIEDKDDVRDLTPSIFAEFAISKSPEALRKVLHPSGVTYCSGLVQDAANTAIDGEPIPNSNPPMNYCIQRQELRLFPDFKAKATLTSSYTIRFQMPSKNEVQDRVHSLRWVVAQWKHSKLSKSYDQNNPMFAGQSPFVAVRFDDAVLHVTVQDEYWRCMVASARHDVWPDMQKINGRIPDEYCIWTGRRTYTGPKPKHTLNLVHHASPVLDNAAGAFTTLRLDIRAGQSGEVVLWQNNTKIATVTGRLGYEMKDAQKSKIKFKFGQYRDYLADDHAMEVDFVEITD